MTRHQVFALVGMPGAGKTVAAAVLEGHGCVRIRFGDLTDIHLARRGLSRTEKNERTVRENLRKKYGMAAYAVLNIPRILTALSQGPVVVDGMYSWEEFKVLKKKFGAGLQVVAIYASPRTRHARLARRSERPLTNAEASGRDVSEIENIGKAGPIAMADWTIVNEGKSIRAVRQEVEKIWRTTAASSSRRSRTGTTST